MYITFIRGITPKRVTSGRAHLRGLAPGQHSSEETSQRWRAVGHCVSNLTGPGIDTQTFRTESDVLITKLTDRFSPNQKSYLCIGLKHFLAKGPVVAEKPGKPKARQNLTFFEEC